MNLALAQARTDRGPDDLAAPATDRVLLGGPGGQHLPWPGGATMRNFAAAIGTVHGVRGARIELSHVPRRWSIRADTYLTVRAGTPVDAPAPVACGIPGFDRPGQEVIASTFRVDDAPLNWDLQGRCGFAADFAYSSRD